VQATFTLDRNSAGAQIVVYNIHGEPLKRVNAQTRQGRVTIPVGDLVPGVYFANLERQGRMIATKRLVVTR
jgi:hypothetical protein